MMKSVKHIFAAMAAILFLLSSSIAYAQDKSIVETAIAADGFETLVAAVKAAGLVDTLNGHDEFTVFAPTDEAFAKLPAGTLETLLKPENKQKLVDILTYHVVSGSVSANDAFPLRTAATVNGQRLSVDFQGERLEVNQAGVVATDIECRNGVIHVIDEVLLPASDTIPTVAENANSFSTLLAAVGTAGLAEVLAGDGPFTVFAPTDAAFDKLPAGTVESLLKPANRNQLTNILKYHVISGRVYATDAVRAGRAATLMGGEVQVNVTADGVKINDSRLVSADIEAANGVIHVVDSVLLPQPSSVSDVRKKIETAVSRGAAVFNSGDHAECCDIYTATMKSFLATGIENADDHLMGRIQETLSSAEQTHSARDRAWVLRRGLEDLYSRTGQMSMTLTSGKNQ